MSSSHTDDPLLEGDVALPRRTLHRVEGEWDNVEPYDLVTDEIDAWLWWWSRRRARRLQRERAR